MRDVGDKRILFWRNDIVLSIQIMSKFVAVFVFLFLVAVVAETDEECQGGCVKSVIHESYNIDPDNNCTTNGTTVTATCRNDSTVSFPLACIGGTWNDTLNETCESCSTHDFGDDHNLMMTMISDETSDNRVPVDTLVSFSCAKDYELRGPKSVLCVGQDDWNDTNTPYCIGKCPDLDVVNGEPIKGVAINATAMVTCSDGYQLSEDSSANITCTVNRSWSPTPECESGTIRFVALYSVSFLAVTIAVLMSHQ